MEVSCKREVLWCRTFQNVLKIGSNFWGNRIPKYPVGAGMVRGFPPAH